MKKTILLAHGSRDPQWLMPFQQLLTQVRGQGGQNIELAFMELAEPSLSDKVVELVSVGVAEIDILPLFFAAGRHLRVDVPKQIAQLEAQYPSVSITLLPPVGEHPEFARMLVNLIQQVN